MMLFAFRQMLPGSGNDLTEAGNDLTEGKKHWTEAGNELTEGEKHYTLSKKPWRSAEWDCMPDKLHRAGIEMYQEGGERVWAMRTMAEIARRMPEPTPNWILFYGHHLRMKLTVGKPNYITIKTEKAYFEFTANLLLGWIVSCNGEYMGLRVYNGIWGGHFISTV